MNTIVDTNLKTILREHLDDDAYDLVARGEIIPGKYGEVTIHKRHAPMSCLMNLVLINVSADIIRIVDEYLGELEGLTRTNYINHMDDYGSILHYVSAFSMRNNNKAFLKVILKHAHDINLCSYINRNTALMAAGSHFCRMSDQETIQLLLNADGDPNLFNAAGANVLHMICELSSSNAKEVEILLNAGADPNLKTNTGVTALHRSCYVSNIKATQLLLNANANPNAQTNRGSTPLIYMMNTTFDITLIQLLLDVGANINIPNYQNQTALMIYCGTNKPDPDIIEFLICKAKADCTLRCKSNNDAYDYLLDHNISPRLYNLLKGYSFVNMTKRAQSLSEN